MSDREVYKHDEREIVDGLDREVDRRGGLFALLACLAIAAGLALATVISIWGGFGKTAQYLTAFAIVWLVRVFV